MEKVINGKRYNTSTARKVGEWWNEISTSDFNFCYEDLYLKQTGEFFLHGRGGSNSKYAKSQSGGWIGGEKLIPLSAEQAREWAEEKLDVGDYEHLFEIPDEDNIQFTALIPNHLYKMMKDEADTKNVPLKNIMILALKKYYE